MHHYSSWCLFIQGNVVAVIVEMSFISNPNEVRRFRDGGMALEVQGILDGALAYYRKKRAF